MTLTDAATLGLLFGIAYGFLLVALREDRAAHRDETTNMERGSHWFGAVLALPFVAGFLWMGIVVALATVEGR